MEGAISVFVLLAVCVFGFAAGEQSTKEEIAKDCEVFEAFVIDGIEYKCSEAVEVPQ